VSLYNSDNEFENQIEEEINSNIDSEKFVCFISNVLNLDLMILIFRKEIDGINKTDWNLLEKVKVTQRQDHMKGINFGSPIANDRLMKELRDIFRSENYKNGNFN
jgi:hypothetical protein